MAFREDFGLFFNTDEFAVQATLAVGGASFPVIFDRAYQAALGGQISATNPQAVARDSDLQALDVVAGTELSIDDVDYRVRDLQPDGTGTTALILEAM